jgi:hypothetical protein
MFLPEHREQLLEKRRSRREYRIPELDEEWLSDINRALSDSLACGQPITVEYALKYETQLITGVVRQIDPLSGWVKLACADDDAGEQLVQIAFKRIIEIK